MKLLTLSAAAALSLTRRFKCVFFIVASDDFQQQ